MNAHTPFDAKQDWTNPYCHNSSNDPMVDALLGNAYHVVRTVYCNLGNLKLIYDFLNQYGMVLGVQSEAELKALTTKASFARIYDKTPAGDRQVTDYLYVEGDRTGILPDDTTATGSWVKVATSGSSGGGESSSDGGYIPWIYNSGSAIGGETTIRIPDETAGAPFMIVNGDWQTEGYDFEYDPVTYEIKFSTPLEQGDFVVVMRTGVPANPDNPNVSDWVTINWLYNQGAAIGGEQVIDIPYTFQSVPAVYKNGLRFYKSLPSDSYTIDSDNNRIILTEPLATNDRLIVQLGGEAKVLEVVDHTVQEVARSANVKDSEVILSTDTTQVLNGKKVIFSVNEQKSYGLPVLPTNVYVQSVANGKLTYNPGSVVVDLLPSPAEAVANEAKEIATTLQTNLASTSGNTFIGGGLLSYGADPTGVTPCDDALSQMIADGKFVVESGKYLISQTHTVDIGLLKRVQVDTDVEFLIKTNISGFIFKNPIANFDANGLRIVVDIPGGSYTNVALTLRGSKYYTSPGNMSRLTQKNQFGPFYVYNRQGAIKQEVAVTPVMDEGYGFSIDCNSPDEEILVWTKVDVSSTGFTVANAIGVGTNALNFISSLDLNLVAWFSTYHFRDTSVPKSLGNVAGGIGDITVRLQSQPHAQMSKVIHIENDIGFMSGCRFNLCIWDANVFGYKAGVVDAISSNEYTNTMERLAYPLTRALNMKDGSLFPIVNYTSSIQESDILTSSSSELAKYLYLSTVTSGMTVIQACNAVKTWCNENNIRNNFVFSLNLGDASADIRNVFRPWLSAVGDDTGFITLTGTYYNGIINSIHVVYELNRISAGRIEKHSILWTNSSNSVDHKLIEYSGGSTADIKSKKAFQVTGFCTFDTTFNIPVWYSGANSWYKSDGSVAYTD